MIAEKAKEQQGTRTDLRQKSDKSSPLDTKKELAKVAGVSHDTIHKAAVIEEKAPEEVKERLRKGETSIHREYTALNRTYVHKTDTHRKHGQKHPLRR